MNAIHLTPWKTAFEEIEAARLAARRELLDRRDKAGLPFGSTAASIKANRNALYLDSKSLITLPDISPRVATELTNDNIRRQQRRNDLKFDRDSKEIIQQLANKKYLKSICNGAKI